MDVRTKPTRGTPKGVTTCVQLPYPKHTVLSPHSFMATYVIQPLYSVRCEFDPVFLLCLLSKVEGVEFCDKRSQLLYVVQFRSLLAVHAPD